jgi:hypothetical protein
VITNTRYAIACPYVCYTANRDRIARFGFCVLEPPRYRDGAARNALTTKALLVTLIRLCEPQRVQFVQHGISGLVRSA